MKKSFIVHQTKNKGYRAVDMETGKVEPLVAGEANFKDAEAKLHSMYEGCTVYNDPEGTYFTLKPICEALRGKTLLNVHIRNRMMLAAREAGADMNAAERVTSKIMYTLFYVFDAELSATL